ncbi:TonB-dependent receptor domain-containing protein [Halorhodospira sp. 9628]|uniref:TonB-dependent receptor domain-containing protein n=1 Tax=Halorhodospira TaxID=85108 RepID=UPI00351D1145
MSRNASAGVAAGLAAAVGCSSVVAGDASVSERSLTPLVVTPSRSAEAPQQSRASVTVIDREQIERSQAQDLPALLRRAPGVNVSQQGGLGKQTRISMRGTGTSQSLLLIDGVRAGSATTGEADLQHIPLSQIERVEVVRGPRSALYGSDAIGGVIQVFTRDVTEEPSGSAGVRIGSERTREVRGSVSGGDATNRYRLSASSLRTRGFDSQVPVDASKTFEPDDDGYRQDSLAMRWSRTLTDDAVVDLDVSRTEGETEYDGTPNQTDFLDQLLSVTARVGIADDVDTTVRVSELRDERTQFDDGQPYSQFDTRRREVSWQTDVSLAPRHDLILGFDWRREDVDTDDPLTQDRRTNRGLFAQYAGEEGPWGWSLGLREDEDEAFGRHVTGDISAGLDIGDVTTVYASYGTAFKAPTFNDLYWPESQWQAGNPDLDPEESETYEVGLQQWFDHAYWAISLFHTDIDDQIDWDTAAQPMRPENVAEVRLRGAELEAGYRSSDWTVLGALTALDAEDRETGERRDRQPPFSGSLEVDRHLGAWSLGGAVEAASYRYDGGGEKRLSGYGVFDLRVAYRPVDGWVVRGKVENVGDKEWYPAWNGFSDPETYYAAPGRRYFVSAEYAF